jgi:flagella basal body P-ring formation protein FlgA
MPDVLSGTPVTLNVHRGALTVSAPGRLLEDGHLGREVRVVNDATRVALEGVLVSPSTVEIP